MINWSVFKVPIETNRNEPSKTCIITEIAETPIRVKFIYIRVSMHSIEVEEIKRILSDRQIRGSHN
jgi:hypothetical protein